MATLRDAANQTWRYSYNALGSLTEVDAPGEHGTRTWNYDTRNLLASESHPESGSTTYDYDSAGRLESKTDARGQVFTYHYDANDRVREIRTPGQSPANQAFTYDASDNRRTLSSGAVTTTFGYDALGNRTQKNGGTYTYHQPTQRLTSDGTTSYQHDAVGNTTVAGTSIYGYSPFNAMTSAMVAGATTTYAYRVSNGSCE